MRLSDLKENDEQLDEILPAIAAGAGLAARTALGVGGAALRGAGSAIAKGAQAVGSAVKSGTQAVGQAAGQAASGLAGGQTDPAQAAAVAKERTEQKKQIQDTIKQKQQELADLQKELTALG